MGRGAVEVWADLRSSRQKQRDAESCRGCGKEHASPADCIGVVSGILDKRGVKYEAEAARAAWTAAATEAEIVRQSEDMIELLEGALAAGAHA